MPGRATLAVVASTAVALGLAACGSASSPPRAAVALTVSAPASGSEVAVAKVRVFGRVVPANAVVVVGGKRAHVANGSFARWVSVRRGVNRIKIAAQAAGYTSASMNVEVKSSLCATSSRSMLAGCSRSRQVPTEGSSS